MISLASGRLVKAVRICTRKRGTDIIANSICGCRQRPAVGHFPSFSSPRVMMVYGEQPSAPCVHSEVTPLSPSDARGSCGPCDTASSMLHTPDPPSAHHGILQGTKYHTQGFHLSRLHAQDRILRQIQPPDGYIAIYYTPPRTYMAWFCGTEASLLFYEKATITGYLRFLSTLLRLNGSNYDFLHRTYTIALFQHLE